MTNYRRKLEAFSYLDIVSSGEPRMDRHASAQKAYAPCASTPGLPEIPPSKVWPGLVSNLLPRRGELINSLTSRQILRDAFRQSGQPSGLGWGVQWQVHGQVQQRDESCRAVCTAGKCERRSCIVVDLLTARPLPRLRRRESLHQPVSTGPAIATWKIGQTHAREKKN